MLAVLALAVPLMAAAPASVSDLQGGHYVLDPHHASLIARVNHMGVALYTVRFDTLDASLDYDPAHPERTRVSASVDPTSLDVNADYSHTFAEEFLQASKFPKATFVSTSIQPGVGPTGTMTGNLTLMGVTRPVTFNVTLIGSAHEPLPIPLGRRAAGFEATTTIKRSDFGSTFLNNMVGDDVTLQIEAEFEKK
ncbi:MAG TPA: YceI family protein [Caulobacteraceae bacterium]|nr:YceI family protein [Caulobacteraceae bacterium]